MEEPVPFEVVTKLDAARRHLEVAIRLFFERKDPIAVLTLTAAARGVLRDLARPRAIKGIDSAIEKKFTPAQQKRIYQLMNKAQNFFKHADKDPNPTAELKFYYEATPFLLLDAVLLHGMLAGGPSTVMSAFVLWSMAKFPDLIIRGEPKLDAFLELAKDLNVDDFDMILFTIDHLKRRKKPRSR